MKCLIPHPWLLEVPSPLFLLMHCWRPVLIPMHKSHRCTRKGLGKWDLLKRSGGSKHCDRCCVFLFQALIFRHQTRRIFERTSFLQHLINELGNDGNSRELLISTPLSLAVQLATRSCVKVALSAKAEIRNWARTRLADPQKTRSQRR
jgi:hypothetical protein